MNVSKKNGWRATSLSTTLDTKTTQAPTSFQTKTVVIYESKSKERKEMEGGNEVSAANGITHSPERRSFSAPLKTYAAAKKHSGSRT